MGCDPLAAEPAFPATTNATAKQPAGEEDRQVRAAASRALSSLLRLFPHGLGVGQLLLASLQL